MNARRLMEPPRTSPSLTQVYHTAQRPSVKRITVVNCRLRGATLANQEGPLWVRTDKTQSEHNESGAHPLADIGADIDLCREGPRPCENSSDFRARRRIPERLRIMTLNHSA